MSVVLIALDENGADATTSFTDQSAAAHTLTPSGDFKWSTAQAPSGLTSSAACDGTGDYLSVADHADFGFGAADFTIEFWWRYNVNTGSQTFVDLRDGTSTGLIIFADGFGNVTFYFSGFLILGSNPAAGAWHHLAVSKASGSTKMFIDGTQAGSTYSDSNNYGGLQPCVIGNGLNGWIAAVRLNKGTALYTANFTPPSLPLIGSATVLDEDGEWIITTQNW